MVNVGPSIWILDIASPAEMIIESVNIASHRFLYNHGNIATEAGTTPYILLLLNDITDSLIVHSTLDSTAHCRPLNGLEHGICTTSMINI